MKRAEHRTEILNQIPALCDPTFVAIESGYIDSVGAADIERQLLIESLQPRTLRSRHHGAEIELLSHYTHEWKRHSVRIGKTKIGKAFANRGSPLNRALVLPAQKNSQTLQRLLARFHPALSRSVSPQELLLAVITGLHPVRQPP